VAARATLWLDALRLSWYRYVVSWSLHDQLDRRRLAAAGDVDVERRDAEGAGRALAAAAGAGRARRGRRARVLARRGLRPAPGERAREFAGRAAAPPFVRLTALYEQVRFGGAPLTPEESEAVERGLVELQEPKGEPR
jgi:uncharacterized protein DUF4129